MPMEKYIVTIIGLKSKTETELEILADEESDDIVLKTVINNLEIIVSDCTYLSAYQKLRDYVLSMGFGMKCNGSRCNAVQSGMLGPNPRIYLVELGSQALLRDIVGIYDYADINEFPNTQEQKEYFQKWIDSLG
jgi:hypothetical protein